MSTLTVLYEQDFYGWLTKNIALLREGRLTEIDPEHVAEELESMGRSEQRELGNRLTVLLAHLLKWRFQSRKRSRSWLDTIVEQRVQLFELLEDSPSLKHGLDERIRQAYYSAVNIASKETKLAKSFFPEECPFSVAQVLDENFLEET